MDQLIQLFLTGATGIFKIGFVLFAILYFIFSLIVLRQVYLMSDTIITQGRPILRVLAIIYAVFSLGVIILFVGVL